MRGILKSRISWLVLIVLMSVAGSALSQETPPQTSPAATTPTVIDSLISWREAALVFLLVVVFFAGLIGYEWVRKRT